MSPLEHLAPVTPPHRPPAAWRQWGLAALDLVFPPFCPVCRRRLGPGRRDPLCGDCWARLERIVPPVCRLCGMPFFAFPAAGGVGASLAGHLCGDCRRRPPAYCYARSAARYEGVVREALHALKFGGHRGLARPLGDLVAETVPALMPVSGADVLVPVPLHPRRERARGFNQADLLARRIGAAWGLPVRSDVLVRTTDTVSQAELGVEQRRVNVRGAFELRRPEAAAGRRVVLVDDILTTGATADACAACLRDAGAVAVGVVTVARVP